uniref:Uncharacterized protein n=1 Tax=Arundo donax TaxID=35708 RepID=A0A0A9DZN7_ARUDO
MPLVRTSQCQPPRPTAFFTTPCKPTSTDLVRLLPVTTTLVCRGSTDISSSPHPSGARATAAIISPPDQCTPPPAANPLFLQREMAGKIPEIRAGIAPITRMHVRGTRDRASGMQDSVQFVPNLEPPASESTES